MSPMPGWLPDGFRKLRLRVHRVNLSVNQSPYMAKINMLVLALGSFPVELALSDGWCRMFLSADRRKPLSSVPCHAGRDLSALRRCIQRAPSGIFSFRAISAPVHGTLLPYGGLFLGPTFQSAEAVAKRGHGRHVHYSANRQRLLILVGPSTIRPCSPKMRLALAGVSEACSRWNNL